MSIFSTNSSKLNIRTYLTNAYSVSTYLSLLSELNLTNVCSVPTYLSLLSEWMYPTNVYSGPTYLSLLSERMWHMYIEGQLTLAYFQNLSDKCIFSVNLSKITIRTNLTKVYACQRIYDSYQNKPDIFIFSVKLWTTTIKWIPISTNRR